jgi:hypothetical protein
MPINKNKLPPAREISALSFDGHAAINPPGYWSDHVAAHRKRRKVSLMISSPRSAQCALQSSSPDDRRALGAAELTQIGKGPPSAPAPPMLESIGGIDSAMCVRARCNGLALSIG